MNERRYCVTGAELGTPMKDYLINGQRPLSEEECIKRFEPLIRELGEAHDEGEKGFTVYPDDLLVRPDSLIVWVQPLGGEKKSIHAGFSPIEQYNDKAEAGTWTDVYTMCATLLYCIKGKIPPSPIERMSGSEINLDGISASVAATLKRGLEIRAEDRIQTFGELTAGLYGRADAADVTEVKSTAAKSIPAAGVSGTPDSNRTVFHAPPEDDNRTVLITQENTDGKTEYRAVINEPAKKQTVQQQFEISAAVQAKAATEKAAVPEKKISEQTPRENDKGLQKKINGWKTVVPLAVLAVVAAASFFAFRDRWSNPAVRDPLPSDLPTQVQQTAQPEATNVQQVEEAIPTMDTKQLVPATTDTAAESPEPEITHAETKPFIPEASTPEPQSGVTFEQVSQELGGSSSSAVGNQETQATQPTNTTGTVGEGTSATEAQPANHNNGSTSSTGQNNTFNNPAPEENNNAAPTVPKNDTSTQTVPDDIADTADDQPISAVDTSTQNTSNDITGSQPNVNNMPPKESGLTEDGLKALTGQYGETEYIYKHGGVNPYYLDKPVVNCNHVRMDLSIEQLRGYGFGPFYLYVKDLDGNWHHVAVFRIEKEQEDGRTVTYELDLDGIESFTAIAFCPAEDAMDFSRRYFFTLYVDPDCVSEYGTEIPRPSFKPAGTDSPVSDTHFAPPRPAPNGPDLMDSLMEALMNDALGDYDFGSDGVCFVAGTPICTEDGLKPIEEIKQGDLVWSWNDMTDEAELKPVVETYINPCTELAHLSVCGETIVCTPQHRFYVPQKGWTRAYALRAGDELVLLNGKTVILDGIQFEKLESPVDVYNFQVQDTHSYYVGEAGIRVHNAEAASGYADTSKEASKEAIC